MITYNQKDIKNFDDLYEKGLIRFIGFIPCNLMIIKAIWLHDNEAEHCYIHIE